MNSASAVLSLGRRARAQLRQNLLLRDSALVFTNNITMALGGMAFWVLAARSLPPDTVGLATSATTMMILLAGIGQMGLGTGLIRFYGALSAQRVAGMFVVVALATSAVSMAFWLLAPRVAPGLAPVFAAPLAGWLFVPACAGWALSVQYDNYLLARRRAGLLALKSVVLSGVRLLLLLGIQQPSATLLVALTGIGGLLSALAVMPLAAQARSVTQVPTAPVAIRTLLGYAIWNYLSGLAGTLPSLAVPTLVVGMLGATKAAAYYMAQTLFSALQFAPSALGWVVFAERAAADTATIGIQRSRQIDLVMLALALLFVPMALAALALLGRTYIHEGWLALLVLTAGFWPYYRSQLQIAKLRVGQNQRKLSAIYTATHLAIVAASAPLLAWAGIAGAALAWSAGQYLLVGLLEAMLHAAQRKGAAS